MLFWLVVTLVGAGAGGLVTGRLTSAQTFTGLASYNASQRIHHIYGTGGIDTPVALTLELPSSTQVASPEGRSELGAALSSLVRDPSLRVASYLNTGDARLIAGHGHATLVLVFGSDNEPSATSLATRVTTAMPAGWTVSATSYQDLQAGSSKGVGVLAETVVGGVGALLVLAIVFGSLLALIPLLVAIVSILTTLLLIGAVTTVASVSVLVEYLVALIGLGIAIDYSLLLVTRWREELARGRSNEEAVVAAFATAGRAVAFSGLTVGIGLLTLVALPIPFVRSLGYAGILIPLVSVAVTTTLLPALLATVGRRLEWPRRKRPTHESRLWGAWASWVVSRRKAAALGATVVLGVLVIAASGMRIGQVVPSSLSPAGPAAAGLTQLTRAGFPAGVIDPIEVLLPSSDPPTGLNERLASVAGVYSVIAPSSPDWHRAGTSLVDVLPAAPTSVGDNSEVVSTVRNAVLTAVPEAAATGSSTLEKDLVHAIYGRALVILAMVILVSIVILTRAFRSLLVAIKALALAMLSIGATIGALVLVWQHGYGSRAIWGIPATGAVIDFVPLIVFAFLFGLSMDYEVFIVSRIKEAHDSGLPADEAIVAGLSRTGRLVTSAAAVLMLAFVALSAGPQVSLKMFATGLAIGIFLDATMIRCLLVPAVLSLLGERAWSHRATPADTVSWPSPAPFGAPELEGADRPIGHL